MGDVQVNILWKNVQAYMKMVIELKLLQNLINCLVEGEIYSVNLKALLLSTYKAWCLF